MTIVRAFIAAAKKNSQRIAVRYWQDGQWVDTDYADLLNQAQVVADWLLKIGVATGDAVVLPSHRSPHLCSQLLGILWAGAHYVFLDSGYPVKRQQLICSEVGAAIGIYEDGQEILPDLPLEWRSIPQDFKNCDAPDVPGDQELPAYIVFTSGSTGKPKGVVIPHRGVTRLVLDTDYIAFDKEQVFLQLSTLSFDASTLELWGPLLNGGTCVLYPENDTPNSTRIRSTVETCGVTTLWLTSSLYNTIISEYPECLFSVRQLLIGGEALSVPHVRKGLDCLPETHIFNGYGPSENTTFTTVYPIPSVLPDGLASIPIGFPINGTYCEVFNDNIEPVADGNPGELIVFGDGLAIEYLNNPELTAERFIKVLCSDGVVRRGYRTGDLVIRQKDGCFEFLQRKDKQVKIDGHRIEPGEIELYLNELEEIAEARVVVKTGPQGQKRLAAYLVGKTDVDRSGIRKKLSEALPAFMVPHFIIPLAEIPKNKNGKIDEEKLPDPFADSSRINDDFQSVANCWQQILGRRVHVDENFLDAGGTSLETLRLTELLEKQFNCNLTATFVFEYPTIQAQARFFGQDSSPGPARCSIAGVSTRSHEIAVIGMACRFPGAGTPDEFWNNLINGVESISFFSDAELSDDISQDLRNHPDYVRAKGIIEDYDRFDADFFGIPSLEAQIMDPQQRVMLQLAWHALEDAGYPPGEDGTCIGVFAGMNWGRYFQQYILPDNEIRRTVGLFNASLANESDFLCSRISYKLNLTGPSINVFTACSTGLVAIGQACMYIERGECDMALAGGVSISTPVKSGYLYQEGNMLSRDGHCRPFDAEASGTTFNDGAGFVALKHLDQARSDGDNIYAVVKGFAINNDGGNKASFTAPSVSGQKEVYDAALAKAGVEPRTVGFIEAHGTATPLGDPIEVKALAESYARSSGYYPASCALGSVKSNIGHTIHAAGVAGFIKAVRAVETGLIPPTLHFSKPNPKLELEKTPFFVNNTVAEWRTESPRRAGVSSLGVGGTNVHIIIEQYQDKPAVKEKIIPARAGELRDDNTAACDPLPVYLLPFSAKSEGALNRLVTEFASYLKEEPPAGIADIAYTLQKGRKEFPHRCFFVCRDIAGLLDGLEKKTGNRQRAGYTEVLDPPVAYLFPGQGAQHLNMASGLYQYDPEFREIIDHGAGILQDELKLDIRSLIFSDNPELEEKLQQTSIAQPALFLVEYAMARMWSRLGIRPAAMIGHSIGELTAACLANVFSFEDGLHLVAQRGRLMQQCPTGSMLSVRLPASELESRLTGGLVISSINAPDFCVAGGSDTEISLLEQKLQTEEVPCRVLRTSHAFHSADMESAAQEFTSVVGRIHLSPPEIPFISCVSGTWITDEQARSPEYWGEQIRKKVLFSRGVSLLLEEEHQIFLEVGPRATMATLVRQHVTGNRGGIISTCDGRAKDKQEEYGKFLAACGRLWLSGMKLRWRKLYSGGHPGRVPLPTYPFERQRFWLDSPGKKTLNPGLSIAAEQPAIDQNNTIRSGPDMERKNMRQQVIEKLKNVIHEATGIEIGSSEGEVNFLELGFDSLLLTQVATNISNAFSLEVIFRQLMEEQNCLDYLAEYVLENSPDLEQCVSGETVSADPVSPAADALPMAPDITPGVCPAGTVQGMESVLVQQLQILNRQLDILTGKRTGTVAAEQSSPVQDVRVAGSKTVTAEPTGQADGKTSEKEHVRKKKPFGPAAKISTKTEKTLTARQQENLQALKERYIAKTARSKKYTESNRPHLADPRVVSGFRPEFKEIIYPIVVKHSKGVRLVDLDGNEYIDMLNGYGSNFFGFTSPMIMEAVAGQMTKGIEIGPQHPLTGEVAGLMGELTGLDRFAFCNTGSEAVLGCTRLARTVTGRKTIVMFHGAYHGIFDEVIVRGTPGLKSFPGAPGIMPEAVQNTLILEYGSPESLKIIKERGRELAAVLVEPVQSRNPSLQPMEFLRELRDITSESGTVLIMDEVITGFRIDPGGAQAYFGVKADLASYGKVVGGGLPIGVIGGVDKFMDALDGGQWQYGDDSFPEVGVTYFAGTFVRHPMVLAAAKAALSYLKDQGRELQKTMNSRADQFARTLNDHFAAVHAPMKISNFGSLMKIDFTDESPLNELVYCYMREKGVHIWDGRPIFLTLAHTDDDLDFVLKTFQESIAEMQSGGFFQPDAAVLPDRSGGIDVPPVPGARLGKTPDGTPAWFISDPDRPGKYIQLEENNGIQQ